MAGLSSRADAVEPKVPLWITPLYRKESNSGKESYRAVKRIVTKTPNPFCFTTGQGEIETTLEEYVGPTGEVLSRRVAVRGCVGVERVLHASFALPDDDCGPSSAIDDSARDVQGHIMCWASFPERPGHNLLCVLANPLLLCIWDVYPVSGDKTSEAIGGGEGNSLILPFEARGIFPLENDMGLLLQRRETLEDLLLNDGKTPTWVTRGDLDEEYDDSGFMLQDPPTPVRLGKMLSSPAGMDMTISQPSPQASVATLAAPIPSLFSLKHPLDEILPVTMVESDGSPAASPPDVLEQILFVGAFRWSECDASSYDVTEYSQPICVSFHTRLKRHAVWLINSAPPPPPPPPLWQVSRNQREENGFDNDFGAIHELPMMEGSLGRIGVSDADMSWHGTTSRNEALADALGVTSRKLEDAATSRGRVGERPRRSGGLKKPPTTIFSPKTTAGKETPMHSISNESKKTGQFPIDTSGPTPDGKTAAIAESPFADLTPDFALTLLYEEPEEGSAVAASNIFLASNDEASGALTLCLVCPVKKSILHELRRLSVTSTRTSPRHAFSVNILPVIPCLSAQPVQATPVPLAFVTSAHHGRHAAEPLATDILVLKGNDSGVGNQLVLYRSGMMIVDCAMPGTALSDEVGTDKMSPVTTIIDMNSPVTDCVDYLCSNNNDDSTWVIRGKISLRFPSSPISNAALAAMDAALLLSEQNESRVKAIETALKIRVDSVRLAQVLSAQRGSDNLYVEDIGWTAVDCVLSSFVESALLDGHVAPLFSDSSKEPTEAHEDWQALLSSDYDKAYRCEDGSSSFLDLDESSNSYAYVNRTLGLPNFRRMVPHSQTEPPLMAVHVFDSLHLLYEESKLSMSRSWCRMIGSLLARICIRFGSATGKHQGRTNVMNDFLDHYRRDLGSKWFEEIEEMSKLSSEFAPRPTKMSLSCRQFLTSFAAPPCFLDWVDSMMMYGGRDGNPTENFYQQYQSREIPFAYRKTRALHRVFSALYGDDAITCGQSIRDDTVVQLLIDEGMDDANALRDELPAGLVLPLMEVLHRCRENPQTCALASWSSEAWSLIGRSDMCKEHEQRGASRFNNSVAEILPANGQYYQDLLADTDRDGILPLEVTSSALFSDNRIHEVGKLLRSSRPMYLLVPRAPEVSDHDYERLKQERLLVMCRRTFAIPLGRGMLTLGNLKPIPADPLPVPLLCLSGRLPPTNASLALDTTSSPADMNVWPEFHNAVAAGLRLPYNEDTSEESLRQITRSWIVYNGSSGQASSDQNPPNNESDNQPSVSHAQGGLLMALGLRGHLSTLKMTDIYDYLTDGVVTTTVGVLLGMAANKRGSCDPAVSKMLCLHIPSLLPASFTGIDVASPAQAAAVTGIGLLYQGSSNRMMTEFLLEEMGKRPTNDSIMPDREAYTLSCGLALGMVNLAKGANSCGAFDGLTDLDLGERLHRLVVGGTDHPEQQKRRKEAAERFSNYPTSERERCNTIFEGDTVNTDVTAPGATLALGLMYMKSGNHAVASSMALPDTHFLLEYIRPDLLLLRVLSRSLILWDDVKASTEWIDEQIPKVVRKSYQQMRLVAEGTSSLSNLSTMSKRDAGDEAVADPTGMSSLERNAAASPPHEVVDKQAVRQIYVHVVAGACYGIGLRFAGTGDTQAAAAVSARLTELKLLREGNDAVSAALRPELQILEMCIGCIAISLAIIMAGTGDLETFNLLRTIRWRCDDDIRYGSHMAYGAAIGLLFLGGGSCTVGRSPQDIAALLVAFFSRLPSTTTDNQHHLQALRHCYALAVVNREIRAVDSETGKIVSVPVEIDFAEDTIPSKQVTAPCLLLNANGTPTTLRVSSDQYYPVAINIGDLSSRNTGITFFVKRRSGYLSQTEGPRLQQRSLVVHGDDSNDSTRKFVEAFIENPTILAYSKYLCGSASNRSLSWVPEFCTQVLRECLASNTEEALPLYLKLRSSVQTMKDGFPAAVEAAWDVRLIRRYYEKRSSSIVAGSTRLLSSEFVSVLNELVEQALGDTPMDENDVLVYMKSGEARQTAIKEMSSLDLLGSFLTFYEMPFPRRTLATVAM